MKHYDAQAIEQLERRFRANLINSSSGFKSANLIGTKSKDGQENVAIFSSVVHLGSDPALIGYIQRPLGDHSHTYRNIMETGVYTINHVPAKLVEQAHYTSARLARDASEFEACRLSPYYLEGFEAPFVAESPVLLGMRFVQEIPIELNGTRLIIGKIEHLLFHAALVGADGNLALDQAQSAVVAGLDSYYGPSFLVKLPYAKASELPIF
ncbi:MAG: flavin reductase [Saprospiraceae bacterium]|jgi:flavin reductase (DIM6/NTAB) family NADH-FMN oxidoreductase RutF|nr:flavin reductase [Saprospiraceae bacterium]